MNPPPTDRLETVRPRRLILRDRRTAPPLALPTLPRLTARLSLANRLSRTDVLRRATVEPDRHR
jgi:hypothetical protein